MNEKQVCSLCGDLHELEVLREFDGQLLCPECLEGNTVVCQDCGGRIWIGENAGSDDHPLCRNCFDRNYVTCARCGRLLREDQACYTEEDEDGDNAFCSVCYVRHRSERVIQEYCFKPEPLFRGGGNRFFGVELEVDEGGERNDRAAVILDAGNSNGIENIYAKHDGSLDDGFEIVTHPMSLEYHRKKMPWGAVLEKARSFGYRSHQATTCGLHVHINRDAYGATDAEQEACIGRVLYFFERFWEELLIFSRRTPRQLERWAARYGYDEHPQGILKKAKGSRAGRYTAVNLTNADTVEFRMFRGTLRLNTLLATLELLDKVSDMAIYLSDDQIKALSWTSFVSGIQEDTYPALVRYLQERRLYVNDIVEVREEEI